MFLASLRAPLAVRLPSALALCGCLALAACGGGDETPENFAPPDYSYLSKLRLNVGSLSIVDHAGQSGPDAGDVGQNAPFPPDQTLQRMAQDRLVAAGNSGSAVFTIDRASIIQEPGGTLDGRLGVHLDIITGSGGHAGYAEAHVSRQLVPGDPDASGGSRRQLYDLNRQMMQDMNVELEYQVRRSLRDWLVDAGGAPLAGSVEQQSLSPPGTAVAILPNAPTPAGAPVGTTPVGAVPVATPGGPVVLAPPSGQVSGGEIPGGEAPVAPPSASPAGAAPANPNPVFPDGAPAADGATPAPAAQRSPPPAYLQPPGYQPQDYPQPSGYGQPEAYPQSQGYPQPPGYAQPQGYAQPPRDAQPPGYAQPQDYAQPPGTGPAPGATPPGY